MKKFLKILGSILLVLLIAWLVCFILPKPQNFPTENPMMKESAGSPGGSLPILIAHGGGNREFPDNTLEAFYNAYSVDPRAMMETDVSITKDGVVILSHDVRLDRKTNVTGAIADWNYADLIAQKVDFGYTNQTKSQVRVEGSELVRFTTDDGKTVTPLDVTYPEGVQPRDEAVFLATTLEELITAFPENAINVEIKQAGETGMQCMREILRLLEKHDAWERVVLASFHNDIYAEYQRLQKAGEVPQTFMCSPGLGNAAMFYVMHLLGLDVLFQDDMCVFQLPIDYELGGLTFDLATEYLVDTAHNHNLAVHYWTINDPDEMRMLIDIGADGIMSDYPHRLAEVYAEYAEAE